MVFYELEYKSWQWFELPSGPLMCVSQLFHCMYVFMYCMFIPCKGLLYSKYLLDFELSAWWPIFTQSNLCFFRWWELSRWPTWVRWPLCSPLLAGHCPCCPSWMTSLWVCYLYITGASSYCRGASSSVALWFLEIERWWFPWLVAQWCRSCISHCILFRAPATSLIVLEDWCCSSKDETGRKWLQRWKHPWIRFHNGFPDAINCASTI